MNIIIILAIVLAVAVVIDMAVSTRHSILFADWREYAIDDDAFERMQRQFCDTTKDDDSEADAP